MARLDTRDIEAMREFGMASSADIARLQTQANKEAEAQFERAKVSEMSLSSALSDAHDALVGLGEDLSGLTERQSLKAMLIYQNRLRGLGILLIGLALVGLVTDYIMMPIQGAAA